MNTRRVVLHTPPILLLVSVCVVLTSCTVPTFANRSPQAAAQRGAQTGRAPLTNYEPLAQRDIGNGLVVVVHRYVEAATPERPATPWFGYGVAEQTDNGWFSPSSGAVGLDPPPPAGNLVMHSIGYTGYQTDRSFIYGETLAPEVAAVEATFNTGQILRDEADDGVFVLAAPRNATSAELRVLRQDGTVLRTVALDVEQP